MTSILVADADKVPQNIDGINKGLPGIGDEGARRDRWNGF